MSISGVMLLEPADFAALKAGSSTANCAFYDWDRFTSDDFIASVDQEVLQGFWISNQMFDGKYVQAFGFSVGIPKSDLNRVGETDDVYGRVTLGLANGTVIIPATNTKNRVAVAH